MKITLIGPYPPFRGGISDFNLSLSNELMRNHEVQIINFTTQYPKFFFPGKTQFKTSHDISNDSDRILSSINYFSWKRSAESIIDFNPNLVILQFWMPFFGFAYNSVLEKIKRKINTQIISICHNLIPHENRFFDKWLTKRYIDNIDKFVLMSQSVEEDLLEFDNSADYVTAFHPIYDLFGEIKEKQVARELINIDSKNIILFFGLIREYKGLDILLNSIPLVKDKIGDFKLIIAGECYENESKYSELIEKLNISEYVIWRNEFIPDETVSNYFCAAEVVVLPYKTATQSGVTQIAYNFNRPVIISDVGGLSEIVKNGVTGYVVKSSAEEIAKAVINFFGQNRFDEFSKNVQQAKENYSWEAFTNKVLDFTKK